MSSATAKTWLMCAELIFQTGDGNCRSTVISEFFLQGGYKKFHWLLMFMTECELSHINFFPGSIKLLTPTPIQET